MPDLRNIFYRELYQLPYAYFVLIGNKGDALPGKDLCMENLNRSMKLSLEFGLSGAVLLPVIYEVYANISTSIGLFLVAAFACFAGVKFSALKFREAFVGITCTIAYSGILGWVCYLFIHPRVVDMLLKKSVYFSLDIRQQLYFLLYCFIILVCIYLIWLVRFGLHKAMEKFKSNSEKTGSYIENAFDDGKDDENL